MSGATVETVCVVCGSTIVREKKSRGRHVRICSKECRVEYRKRKRREYDARNPGHRKRHRDRRREGWVETLLRDRSRPTEWSKFSERRFPEIFFLTEVPMNAIPDDMPASNNAFADLIIRRAIKLMEEREIPLEVLVDRLTTFAAGAHVSILGEAGAADCFREYAAKIESGVFHGNGRDPASMN